MSAAQPGRGSGIPAAEFERHYRQQWPAIVDYLRFRIGPEDAIDTAADVFARAWAARAQYDPDRGGVVGWIWGIARNAARDSFRRGRPRLEAISDDLPSTADLSREGARAEAIARVAMALRRLDPVDQEIVALRFGGGMTNRDAGRMVGLSEGATAQRLHRAIKRLRNLLEESAKA